MKRMIFCLMAMMGVLTLSAQSIYGFTVKDDAGKDVSLAEYKLNYILAIGYPDEQPNAKPRDASKVKYIK